MADAAPKKKRKVVDRSRQGLISFAKQLDVLKLVTAVAVIGIMGNFWVDCKKDQRNAFFPVKLTGWDPEYEWSTKLHGAFDAVSQPCEQDPDPAKESFKLSIKHLHTCARQGDLKPYLG